MNLRIYGERQKLWQWDTGRKLIVEDNGTCNEVHFANAYSKMAMVLPIREREGLRVVDIPNILLQQASPLTAYMYRWGESGSETFAAFCFGVASRQKPESYIYTETEILCYRDLDERMRKLEENLEGEAARAVEKYLQENPIDGVKFETDDTLSLQDGVLSVKAVNQVIEDDLRPVTSGAVYEEFSKAVALLKTI